jgi:cbb3-type cytochrome oxidase subunit 3
MLAEPRLVAADALLSMLLPLWQLVIGGCVLLAVIVSIYRLAQRGRSRMATALLVTGGAALGLVALGILLDSR